jgi:biopolymer transport protein TolR
MAFTASNGRTQTAMADINITPLVDVVLVLLIIFMVTAPVLQSGIDVSVPKTKHGARDHRRAAGDHDQQRSARLSGQRSININEIASKLRQKIRDPANQSIFVRADENVPFGAFRHGDGRGEAVGITNVSIVTQPLDKMAANAEIYFEHDRWGRALAWSAGLACGNHGVCSDTRRFASFRAERRHLGRRRRRRSDRRNLVSTVPLPANPTQTQNVLANESKGITQSQPKAEEKEPDAIEIQGKNAKIKPKPQSSAKQKPSLSRKTKPAT